MPSEKQVFTRASILFRPHRNPGKCWKKKMVEAPGTAPGSASLIAQVVYRYSWLPSAFNIG